MNPDKVIDPSHDDLGLARRIAAGDRSAFEFLMRRHNRRLYRLARAMLRDDAEAEDALQEAYLDAYRAIGSFRGDSLLITWLSRMVLNECLGRVRKNARRQNVIPMGPNDEMETTASGHERDRPERQVARAEIRVMLERKLDQLPQDFRTVFVLRAVEELSVEETAALLGIPEATVRSRHFRARGLLRESLAQEFDMAERDVFDFGGAHCDHVVAGVMSRLAD